MKMVMYQIVMEVKGELNTLMYAPNEEDAIERSKQVLRDASVAHMLNVSFTPINIIEVKPSAPERIN